MSRNILLLMMGGSGTRFGADIPKQFVEVNGKPIFIYIVEKYLKTGCLDAMIVVCHESWIEYTESCIVGLLPSEEFEFKVVPGGASRSESVKNGIVQCASFAAEDDVVLIHDATHPYVDETKLDALIQATRDHGGATMGECQYDTVYGIDSATGVLERVIPRETVVSGASPEAFLYGLIKQIYDNTPVHQLEEYTSAGALALANDICMQVISTDLINLKITYRHDMEVFKLLFHNYYF